MLKQLKLTCFKQHVERTIDFTPGVNGVRAPNGSGKSNALLAARYALYGAKALSEPLEDVVTYGQPTSKLKVELDFDFAGVDYRIVRGKSGAEVTFGLERITGQTECTRFIESLFNASQDLGSKLMFAKQKAVGGALSDGPTAASAMIEDLANLDLIDELVGLIGEKLPAGNTTATEGMISTLREQVEPGELPDLRPLEVAAAGARVISETATADHAAKKAELDQLDLDAARAILGEEKVLRAAILDKGQRIAVLGAQLAAKVPEAPDLAAIEELRTKIEGQKHLAEANRLHAGLAKADVEVLWDKPMGDLEEEITAADVRVQELETSYLEVESKLRKISSDWAAADNYYQVTRTRIEGQLIKETTCALCKKDLSDVPEVARFNSPLQADLTSLEAEKKATDARLHGIESELNSKLPQLRVDLAAAREYLGDLNAVVLRSRQLDTLYAGAARFIKLDHSTVPATWSWTGPSGEPFDYLPKLRELEAARDNAQRATAAREQAEQQLADLRVALHSDEIDLMALQIKDANETLEMEATLKPQVQALQEAAQAAERALAAATQAFELARSRREQLLDAAEKAKASLAAAEATLAEMQANNALIKKLRAARPQITDKLWSIVLAATSTYYSDMRGSVARVTREEGRFRINGKPVTGMSGAEEDILGLAVRMALTKSFLPSVDFLVLDEVAAACDDEREAAILGLLSTVGFKQVILVTHSPAIDAVANNIITI